MRLTSEAADRQAKIALDDCATWVHISSRTVPWNANRHPYEMRTTVTPMDTSTDLEPIRAALATLSDVIEIEVHHADSRARPHVTVWRHA